MFVLSGTGQTQVSCPGTGGYAGPRLAMCSGQHIAPVMWMQLFNTPLWTSETAAGAEWLHPACIHHLAIQKNKVIVIEQYHMINTFPPEIFVPQRLGMMNGQASPWHSPPSSRLLSRYIFLWRHIRQIFEEEEQEWTCLLVKGKKQLLFKFRNSEEAQLCLNRILVSGWCWFPFLVCNFY